MAAPTLPTLVSITTEGIKKAGIASPTADELTRAQNEWMEEIKNDIWMLAKKLTSLQTIGIVVTIKGIAQYSFPTDYSSIVDMKLGDWSEDGTAQAGSASSITLQSNETFAESFVQGKEIVVVAGTALGQISQISAYNSTTKVATINPNFTTNPVSGDIYQIIDNYYELRESTVQSYDKEQTPTALNIPKYYMPIGDSSQGKFILFKTPDKIYPIKIRYYANLMTLDLAGTLMNTLYSRWRNLFTQGIFVKYLEFRDDARMNIEKPIYVSLLQSLIIRETYGTDLSNLQRSIQT